MLLYALLLGCTVDATEALDVGVVDVVSTGEVSTRGEPETGSTNGPDVRRIDVGEDSREPAGDVPSCESFVSTAVEAVWGGSVETTTFPVRVQFINRNHQGGLFVHGDWITWMPLRSWFKADGLDWMEVGIHANSAFPNQLSENSYLIGYYSSEWKPTISTQDRQKLTIVGLPVESLGKYIYDFDYFYRHSARVGRFVCVKWPLETDRTCQSLDGGVPWTVSGTLMGGPFHDWAMLYAGGAFHRLDLRVNPPVMSPAPMAKEAVPPLYSAQFRTDGRVFIEGDLGVVAYREYGDPEVVIVKDDAIGPINGQFRVMSHGWIVFGHESPVLPWLRAPSGTGPTLWSSKLAGPLFHWMEEGRQMRSCRIRALSGHETAPECACATSDGQRTEGRRALVLAPESATSLQRLATCVPAPDDFWPTAGGVAQWNSDTSSGVAIVTTVDPANGEPPHYLDALSGEGRLEAIYWLEPDRLWNVAIPGLTGSGTGIVSRCDIAGAFQAGGVVIQCLIGGDVVSTALWRDDETFRFARIAQRPGDWTNVAGPGAFRPTSLATNTRSGRCIGLSGGPSEGGGYDVDVACFPPEQ
jgi:hypothetical protein